jgi:hypothetical protein
VTFDDGPKTYHPVPSLNANVVAARTAAQEMADGGDDDDDDDKPSKKGNEKANTSNDGSKKESKTALLSARQRELQAQQQQAQNKTPTDREIEEGVKHAVSEAVEHHGETSHEGRGAKHLNAFDLVNQCGGFALERVFRPRADKVTKREFQFSSYRSIDHIMSGLTGM